MLILNGKEVAQVRKSRLKKKTEAFTAHHGRPPGLGVVLVGDDPASHVYVKNKVLACDEVGFFSREVRIPQTASQAELKTAIESLNQDSEVDAFLVQLPLPKSLDAEEALSWIDPHKDADGLTAENVGLFWLGRPRAIPCTPAGVMAIFEHYDIPLTGKKAVVVGRSQIVGRPMAQLLLEADATVTIAHSKTRDLSALTREADVVVVAAGRAEFLGKEDFKKDAVVIDVGMHRKPLPSGKNRLCGDVRYAELEGHVAAATPVPGGVGPMTIAMLLENTLRLAELRKN
jgi:methylenetetrahydrofolate dehydrogenase (NADP+)/methenyltetrahydrofolate cyclohydrolase